jgi:hypothetical protein
MSMSAAMQIAERVNSLAQEQLIFALMIEAHRALAATFYFSGNSLEFFRSNVVRQCCNFAGVV